MTYFGLRRPSAEHALYQERSVVRASSLARISHNWRSDVAHAPTRAALAPAVSRLFSTLRGAATQRPSPSVARSGDAARNECVRHIIAQKVCDKCGWKRLGHKERAAIWLAARGCACD